MVCTYLKKNFYLKFHRRRVRSRSRMRRLLWFAAVLWASWLGCISSSSLDPNKQAQASSVLKQVSTALDSAQFVINEIAEENKAAAKALKEARKISDDEFAESAKILATQMKLTKYASMIGRALNTVQAVSSVASFVFTFFMPSELDVITSLINERFKEVNAKLDI